MEKELLVRHHAEAAAATGGTHGGPRLEPQGLRASRYGGAQHKVWEEVSETMACLDVDSATSALADNFNTRGRDLDEYLEALSFADGGALDSTAGVMVFFDGRFVCVDLLQPSKRFSRLYPKLLRGYALEALVSANKRDFWSADRVDSRGCLLRPASVSTPADFDPEASALRLFAELRDAVVRTQPAADLGEDVRLETKSASGAGLAWNAELIQLSLFPNKAA
jgi:hypothetical protein